jgi:hypothetical protein
MFLKLEKKSFRETYILVIVQNDRLNRIVMLAYRILPELIHDENSLEPLNLLHQLAYYFGLPIRICNETRTFVVFETLNFLGELRSIDKAIMIINPDDHDCLLSSLQKVEMISSSIEISFALTYCIDTLRYRDWLFGRQPLLSHDVTFTFAPSLKGYATANDFIIPTGTLQFTLSNIDTEVVNLNLIFKLYGYGFDFEIGYTSDSIYMLRNGHRVDINFSSLSIVFNKRVCFASWGPTKLELDVIEKLRTNNELRTQTANIQTPPTLPPNSLIDWLRRESVTPIIFYKSNKHFYEVVISCLQEVATNIKSLNLHSAFWDIAHEGASRPARYPKDEVGVHPTIHGMLRAMEIAKNFKVIREYPIAGGNLDFLIIGTLTSGEQARICVEFKPAHSGKVFEGLFAQLPAYMDAEGADFGIYCLLWFKGLEFDQPALFETEGDLLVEIQRRRLLNKFGRKIRVLVYDLSPQVPPSKLKLTDFE